MKTINFLLNYSKNIWDHSVFSYENNFIPENSGKPTLLFRFISVDSGKQSIPENMHIIKLYA
jgi:hypothetical protein